MSDLFNLRKGFCIRNKKLPKYKYSSISMIDFFIPVRKYLEKSFYESIIMEVIDRIHINGLMLQHHCGNR
eukprot:snap_masked-scaffold_11-processed-gene-4.21-mRNA-1 protein AED:1.00 eAED:1.00 QI:0/0/0/0/1/1/2/0/69